MEITVNKNIIKGINVCNPIEVEKEYLLKTVEYAHKHGITHIEINGPIHNREISNIDGMTYLRKYAQFNANKNDKYIEEALDAVNAGCEKASEYGIQMYLWHHELELPDTFKEVYPEVLNEVGDIEVTHPLVKDFLENKIKDFFYAYPKMHGIVLTLHETSIPLLKLKAQKLTPVERVKYVTKILFDTAKALGKDMIVRNFASLEEDCIMMTKAYAEISPELIVMDKWTQFDWSLAMPENPFFKNITKNPIFVEGDIFGEFFGKGQLPLMLKDHIARKLTHCGQFNPKGYCLRIDRAGFTPFGDLAEVNLVIANAYLDNLDVDAEIDKFFVERYGEAGKDLRLIMDETDKTLTEIMYTKKYYYTELSYFPTLNHSKNHYYFEMMKKDYDIISNEWYVPRNWERGEVSELLELKKKAKEKAESMYNDLLKLESRLAPNDFKTLRTKFANLKYMGDIWYTLLKVFKSYVQYFEDRTSENEAVFYAEVLELSKLREVAVNDLGDAFYPDHYIILSDQNDDVDSIEGFIADVKKSFELEKASLELMDKETDLVDFVICGGGMEGHRLLKEVNFSDTFVSEDGVCRIPGNRMGAKWSAIKAHGWFSYELKVKPLSDNTVTISIGSLDESVDVDITIGNDTYTINEKVNGKKDFTFTYKADNSDCVRIRFDKTTENIPRIYSIKVK